MVDTDQCKLCIVWELPLLLAETLPVPEEVPSNDVMFTKKKCCLDKDYMTLR